MNKNNTRPQLATPDNWHWAIIPQQVIEIKQGNRDTINKVYFDNLPKFQKVISNFYRNFERLQFFDDCIQQIYLDLPRYRFDNSSTFYRSLLRTARCVAGFYGQQFDIFRCVSFETPLKSCDDKTVADTLQVLFEYTETEQAEQNKRIVQIIQTQRHLTEYQQDWLVAVAFGCEYRRGLYDTLCLLYPV